MSEAANTYPRLYTLLTTSAGFTDEEYLWYANQLEVRHLKKKEHFLRVGEIARHTVYVNKGCVRRYVIDEHGKEITVTFALENWWTGDLESFMHNKPSTFFVQALEESELLLLPKEQFERVCRELPKYKAFHDAKIEQNHYATLKRLTVAASGTPEERYLLLMEKLPEVFQRVPQHYIASYLGIEPESLSRLRRRISGKK